MSRLTPKPEEISVAIQRAVAGSASDMERLVDFFGPALLVAARYRMGTRLHRLVEAEDLVSEVWAVALPHLSGFVPREGSFTPAVLRFLTNVLQKRVLKYLDLSYRRQELHWEASVAARAAHSEVMADIPESTTGVLTGAARRDAVQRVVQEIDALDEPDREVIVLRAIEQRGNQEVASLLGLEPGTVATRYHRALARLRDRCPRSVFTQL